MTIAQRLLARLRAEGHNLPSDAEVVRVYPSRSQRSAGAWTWTVRPLWTVGSQYSMTTVLKAEELIISTSPQGDTDVDPKGV